MSAARAERPIAPAGSCCGWGVAFAPPAGVLHGGDGAPSSLPTYTNIGRNYKCHLNSALIVFSPSVVTDALRKTTILFHEEFPHSSVQNLGWLDGELIALELPSFAPHGKRHRRSRAYGFWITTEDGSHPHNRVAAPTVMGWRRSTTIPIA